jgi:formylglycine-generating enzyme required for sulfatase activity
MLEGEDEASVRGVKQLRDFLTRFDGLSGSERPDHISERAFSLYRDQSWIFETLLEIAGDEAKLITLVNLGSPAPNLVEEPRNEPRIGGGRKLPTGADPEWVQMPGGLFLMGDREIASPEHSVTVSPFAISRYPITNEQYFHCVEQGTELEAPEHWQGDEPPDELLSHPVTQVSCEDAKLYCGWLASRLRELEGDEELAVDLPTEAQWEYAARGGDKSRPYPWGEAEPSSKRANFGGAEGGTTPVDRYPVGATPEGVWDLAGNVWEWCRDWYADYQPESVENPEGPTSGDYRVLRGGSFGNEANLLRAAFRFSFLPEYRNLGIGFRVVCVPGGQT